MGFSRKEDWSGLPCPHPGHLPDPGIEPVSPVSPALAGGFFTTSATWESLWLTFSLSLFICFKVFTEFASVLYFWVFGHKARGILAT